MSGAARGGFDCGRSTIGDIELDNNTSLSLVDEGRARQLAPPLEPPATDLLRVRGGGPPRLSQLTPVQLHRHSRRLGSGGGQLAEPAPLRLGHPGSKTADRDFGAAGAAAAAAAWSQRSIYLPDG